MKEFQLLHAAITHKNLHSHTFIYINLSILLVLKVMFSYCSNISNKVFKILD